MNSVSDEIPEDAVEEVLKDAVGSAPSVMEKRRRWRSWWKQSLSWRRESWWQRRSKGLERPERLQEEQ